MNFPLHLWAFCWYLGSKSIASRKTQTKSSPARPSGHAVQSITAGVRGTSLEIMSSCLAWIREESSRRHRMPSTHFVFCFSCDRNNLKQLHRLIWVPDRLACSLCTNLPVPDMHTAFPHRSPGPSKRGDGKCHSYELFKKMLPIPHPPTCYLLVSTKG